MTVNFEEVLKKVILILSIILILQSCGEEKLDNQIDKNIISFWHFWSEPYQQEILDTLINRFEKQNNCTVETTLLSWNDGKMKLTAAFNSNTAPDVLELGSDWTAQFASAGVLMALSPEEYDFNRFLDFSLIPSKWKDNYYTIPWSVATRALFCNRDLFDSSFTAPKSYNDLLKYSGQINNAETIYGIGVTSDDEHRLYKKILPMFWTYGGGIFDKNGNIIIDNPKNIKALDMYCQLSREGVIETQRQIDAMFVKGKVGFCVSGPWLEDKLQNENPDMNYEVLIMPGTETKKGFSFAGGEYLAINKKSPNISLSQSFIKYMTSGKNAVMFCKEISAAGFPADKKYYSAPELLEKSSNKVFAEQLKYSRMTPMHPKWLDIEKIIEIATVEALYGKKTPKEALEEAKENIQNIVK